MNPHKNPRLIAEYCERNDFDEVLFYTGIRINRDGPSKEHRGIVDQGDSNFLWRRLELNHIWSNGMRPDYRSNVIRMLKSGHDFFHENLSQGRTLCVLAKLLKRKKLNDPSEFDLSEMQIAAGKNLRGTIENYGAFDWDQIMVEAWVECVGLLRELEAETK